MTTTSLPMLLRVEQPDQAPRKLKLGARPDSVDSLIRILKHELDLDLDVDLLYEDPDSDGKLTALTDINELPQKAVVHITFSQDSSSVASTVLLSDVSSPERLSRWPPGPFPIPMFSFDVELKLRDGNAEYENKNTYLNLTRDLKHSILESMASTIYGFKAYPSDKEISMAAEALVAKHPCLTQPGAEKGWNGWKNSIKFKMGNYRNKMRRAGCQEVAVNSGKRSRSHPEKEPSHSNIKRPKRAELNFLPNFPKGKDPSQLEEMRQTIVDECKKVDKDLTLIRKLMEATFPLRRQTIVMSFPPVNEIMDLWPALKIESELYAEFQRLTNQNLPNTFYAELDRHLPRMMTLFRQKAAKTGKTADALASILKLHDEQESHDIHSRRTTALQALPVYLRDDATELFRTCTDDSDEPDLDGVALGLLTFANNDAGLYNALRVSVVIEGAVVMSVSRHTDAFLIMFGLMYALHLSYPKALINTFEFVQKILLGLDGGKLSPKLQTMKIDLSM
ncbi:uncharacterized protein LOC132891510 isoform X2 [Neoarius graeffei]|uniref:uncharacterized protein LOC132891510 isoform X2 n=1 Tax=Neoarius graeffei TaxID=443677 RepID=UPI00298C6650|nr:uncharacterized protein LOC132891510 isoform X2 [Neoarius graeffei]XP_060785153.1 uncharacterized protein LOC132891510 isoform X2 [Neoarius graeffei]XP_060785154.1 uncharacterized protein LOC132891510 isoform X2 [Neoarius graeffei]